MEQYYKKQCLNPSSNIPDSPPLPSNIPGSPPPPSNIPSSLTSSIPGSAQQSEVTELDEILANLPADLGLRRRMLDYPLNCRKAIRRYYLQNEPCQPKSHIMPRKTSDNRCFITGWFDKFKWLKYSIVKDVSFCCYCYLFKCDFDKPGGSGSDVFIEKGFTNWMKGLENFQVHESGVGSLHNKAMQQAKDLMTQKQHIETFVIKQIDEAHVNYHTLLSGALDCTRWLLRQGLAFRGHDDRGNYIELMQFLADHNDKVRKVVFENAPKNLNYTSSDIQKDLVRACASETINAITKDMESLVFVAKENEDVANFFINASSLVNLIGSSCKRRDVFIEKQQEQIHKALDLALQKKDQDIVNAMALVEVCKQRLQSLKDDDFGDLFLDVERFCEEHDIIIPNMEDLHFVSGKSRHKAPKTTNFHYYRLDLYFQVLDMQLKELNDRFNEMHSEFLSLRIIKDLAKELVKTGRCESYKLVYKLLTLILVLPAATASVERAFSAMKIVKTPLRNKMGDQWLSDSMIVYIERDVDNELICDVFMT
ncbi:unnamed protein product [Malus baccata var. baccata]